MEVYGIFNKEAQRFVYIGATKQDAFSRFAKHIKDSYRLQPHTKIARLLRSAGRSKFEPRVLKVVETVEDLLLMEIAFIAKYDTFHNGCNETIGGNGWEGRRHSPESLKVAAEKRKGYRHTEEAKKLISEAGKGRIFSDETRRKISEANVGKEKPKGADSPLFGIPRTDETRRKIGNAGKGRIATDEARKNMSAAGKGKPKSEAHKKALSESKKGKGFSDEHKQKLKEAWARRRAEKKE